MYCVQIVQFDKLLFCLICLVYANFPKNSTVYDGDLAKFYKNFMLGNLTGIFNTINSRV